MGLFEDVVINAKSAANAVGKKAGQLVDVSKLKISAAELNNEINKKYEQGGLRRQKSRQRSCGFGGGGNGRDRRASGSAEGARGSD